MSITLSKTREIGEKEDEKNFQEKLSRSSPRNVCTKVAKVSNKKPPNKAFGKILFLDKLCLPEIAFRKRS
jgi:hypothetical protein